MTARWDIVIAGVGGQGIILASEVLAEVALAAGLDVKKSDVHGMAQRGGSVVSFVRLAEQVASPLIEVGKAGMLIAFERLEALRWRAYLAEGGLLVLNNQKIIPPTVAVGEDTYPENVEDAFRDCRVLKVDGQQLAQDAGNSRAVNSVLLGVLSTLLKFPEEGWREELKKHLPAKLHPVNLKAFELGREAGNAFSR